MADVRAGVATGDEKGMDLQFPSWWKTLNLLIFWAKKFFFLHCWISSWGYIVASINV